MEILVKIANYVTDLLSFDETKVLIGRDNATQEVFSQDYIIIDSLTPGSPVGSNREYDYDLEKEKFNTLFSSRITLEFYGDNAYNNAYKFINLQNSQLARDLQKTHGVTLFKALNINNLKQVVGNRYFDRYEIEITVQYNAGLVIDTLRIEEIPVSYSQN